MTLTYRHEAALSEAAREQVTLTDRDFVCGNELNVNVDIFLMNLEDGKSLGILASGGSGVAD